MTNEYGAFSIQELKELQKSGFFQNFEEDSFQPASVDLSVSEEIYRIKGSILPRHGESIRELLKEVRYFQHNIANPLEPGATYLCKIREKVRLPKEFYGYANPKSSTGRNNIHVRLVADSGPRYDTITRGFSGELWLMVSSKNFLLQLSPGDRLSQLRVFNSDTRLQESEMMDVYEKEKLLWRRNGEMLKHEKLKISDHDGSLILTINLNTHDVIGYRARPRGQSPVLVFNRRDHSVSDFFIPIERLKNNTVVLENGQFYIFCTSEWVRVPVGFAAEMAAMDEHSGEFRSHYAGFIDPGWGYGRNGKIKGLPLVIEVVPFDDNLIVRSGQPICKLKYEKVRKIPEVVYGETGSHYTSQTNALLSKHFVKT